MLESYNHFLERIFTKEYNENKNQNVLSFVDSLNFKIFQQIFFFCNFLFDLKLVKIFKNMQKKKKLSKEIKKISIKEFFSTRPTHKKNFIRKEKHGIYFKIFKNMKKICPMRTGHEY